MEVSGGKKASQASPLILWARSKEWESTTWEAITGLLTFVAGAISTHFEPWKSVSNRSSIDWISAILLVLAMGIVAFVANAIRLAVKKTESEIIEELKSEIEVKEHQVSGWVGIANQIQEIIGHKRTRISPCLNGQGMKAVDVLAKFANADQPKYILQMIDSYFREGLAPNKRMRIGLYSKENGNHGSHLSVWYSWNGVADNCIQIKPADYKIDDPGPKNRKAEVTKLYLDGKERDIKIIPDCEKEQIRYFDGDQQIYLQSMLLFKYVLQASGTKDALILCIDCEEKDHFQEVKAEEYKLFLVEMLSRIDYEFLAIEIVKQFQSRSRKPTRKTRNQI